MARSVDEMGLGNEMEPGQLVTHRFAMNDIMKAYDTFGNAAKEGALKVVLKNDGAK